MSVLMDDTPTGPMLWDGPHTTDFIHECRTWEETERIPTLRLTVEEYRAVREGRAEVTGDVRQGLRVHYLR